MNETSFSSIHRLVWISLCAALTAAGAFITIPLPLVPITLQTMFVTLAGFILGPLWGPASIGLYLVAGIMGLPVFSEGNSGLAYMAGPTGGYLIGFLGCAFACGLLRQTAYRDLTTPPGFLKLFTFALIGLAFLFAPGLVWLAVSTGMNFTKVLSVGLLPFIPGAIIKCAMAAAAYRYLLRWKLLHF